MVVVGSSEEVELFAGILIMHLGLRWIDERILPVGLDLSDEFRARQIGIGFLRLLNDFTLTIEDKARLEIAGAVVVYFVWRNGKLEIRTNLRFMHCFSLSGQESEQNQHHFLREREGRTHERFVDF